MIASLYFNLDSQSSNLNIIIWCDICVLCSIIEVTKGGEKSWMIDYANFFALDSFMSVCVQLNDWIIINIQEHIHKNLRLASFFFFFGYDGKGYSQTNLHASWIWIQVFFLNDIRNTCIPINPEHSNEFNTILRVMAQRFT